jgi:cytidine deaminase
MALSDRQRDELIQAALKARQRAYAPYSHYAVGAALLTDKGSIFVGVNVENAAYPQSICAERSAVFAAVSSGERAFQAIAVATDNGGSPCGACRQVLAEFGLDIQILLVDRKGKLRKISSVGELLPSAFTPADLQS